MTRMFFGGMPSASAAFHWVIDTPCVVSQRISWLPFQAAVVEASSIGW